MVALAGKAPAHVLGDNGALIEDRPGFEIEFLTGGSITGEMRDSVEHEVLMVHRGHWNLVWDDGTATLAPGDTCALPPGLRHGLTPSMSGEAALFRVRKTDDLAGPTRI